MRGNLSQQRKLAVASALLVALAVAAGGRAGSASVAGPAPAIDGDSLEVGDYELRLHGMDAPEWKQLCERGGERYRCGQVAARALAEKIDRRKLE